MAGFGNNAAAMGGWMSPNPSQRNFFSSLMAEEFDPKSISNGDEGPFLKSNGEDIVLDHEKEEGDGGGLQFSTDLSMKPNSVNAYKPSLTERRAARAGFSAPTINTDQIRAANFGSSSSEIRSPYLTIPPGLSPTTLLDSPVFLSNSLPASTLDPELSSERKLPTDDVTPNQRPSSATTGNECSPPPDNSQEEEKVESLALGAPAEDGYNWRKYGQKHVKGSEYPRSYYKCTHPSCPVKKKVERNHEGQVTEIIYKGAHNHPKPAQNRRSGVPSSHPFNEYQSDGHDWRNDGGLEATPPPSGATEFGETQEAGEVLSTLSNEDEEDRATHGSVSVGCDGEGEETESKRRKVNACAVEMSAGSRAVREPRVVVQTTSDVDILDDGYRWRKYGQKVVKGNPNPRSYYKCTNPGCSVRKHVERASHDLKSVITTYEGKHNHEVPAARGSSGSASSLPPTSAAPQAPRAQETFTRYNSSTPLGAFSLPGQERVIPGSGNFSFGVGPPCLSAANLAMSSFGPMAMPPVNAFMGHHHAAEAGYVVPKGEPKEEPASDPTRNMSNGASAYYHQLMGRMPIGPQM